MTYAYFNQWAKEDDGWDYESELKRDDADLEQDEIETEMEQEEVYESRYDNRGRCFGDLDISDRDFW